LRVFVKKTVRRRGDKAYEYLSLVEAVREDGKNTHRTLARLGEVSELRASGQLDRIIKALRTYAEGSWFELSDAVFVMLANRLVDPGSKRRTITEWLATVALPKDVGAPSLDRCYRAVDALAACKEGTESHLYSELCNLTNLDLRLVCQDLTSTYFETVGAGGPRFSSRDYGYSRDHRSDRPQVVIGLLVTGDGIPIATTSSRATPRR
jgi:hypothetical protein